MSNNSSNRVVRTLGVPAMALVLASTSMVALAGTAAAKPMPVVHFDSVMCEKKDIGSFQSTVTPSVRVSYKGKWVDFEISTSIFDVNGDLLGDKTGWALDKYEAGTSWSDGFTFSTKSEASQAFAEVWLVNKRGVAVEGPFRSERVDCVYPTPD